MISLKLFRSESISLGVDNGVEVHITRDWALRLGYIFFGPYYLFTWGRRVLLFLLLPFWLLVSIHQGAEVRSSGTDL